MFHLLTNTFCEKKNSIWKQFKHEENADKASNNENVFAMSKLRK